MTGKFDWSTFEEMFDMGGYAVNAALTDRAAFLALIGLNQLQSEYLWQNYDDFDDVETAIDDAIAQIMNGNLTGGSMIKIAEKVVTADTSAPFVASFESGTYHAFELWVEGLKSSENSVFVEDVIMQFNLDTVAANYNSLSIFEDVDTYLRYEHIGNYAGIRMYWSTSTIMADDDANGHFKMRFYAPQGDDIKYMTWQGTASNLTAGQMVILHGQGIWNSENPITSIKIFPRLGANFVVNPDDPDEPSELRMTLYGLE